MSDLRQCPALSTSGHRCDRWDGHGGRHTSPAGTIGWWDPAPVSLQCEATIAGIDPPPRCDGLPDHAGNHHALITGDGNTMRIEWKHGNKTQLSCTSEPLDVDPYAAMPTVDLVETMEAQHERGEPVCPSIVFELAGRLLTAEGLALPAPGVCKRCRGARRVGSVLDLDGLEPCPDCDGSGRTDRSNQ